LIAEGVELVRKSVMTGRLGRYVIQAAIATVHAAADSVETTNWDLIVEYYDMLAKLQDSPVVALNRAIAVGMRDGPRAGLVIVRDLLESGVMSDYHFAHAARADLARRAASLDEARASYRRALELVRQEPERRYLQRCLARIPE
jgi:RNA polymerase sigma-70 factor (ECF subfamily)